VRITLRELLSLQYCPNNHFLSPSGDALYFLNSDGQVVFVAYGESWRDDIVEYQEELTREVRFDVYREEGVLNG
jgi:hypothetical protein